MKTLSLLLLSLTSLALSSPLDALQDAFQISRPFLGTQDSSFYCKLANNAAFDTCKFTTPSGNIYLVSDDNVTDANNEQVVPGVTPYGLDENGNPVCGLKFSNFNDFGWWSCLMEAGFFAPIENHVGTFKINKANEWPKDIRLPNDITVS